MPPANGDYVVWFRFAPAFVRSFDPRNNTPRIGRVLISQGRDAADVALSNTFGPSVLTNFRVCTDEVSAA